MRARKQHSRREIQSYKSALRQLVKFGTEFEVMQFLREIEIFDEDPRFVIALKAFRDLKKGKL
jgi:hypothetical protein